MVLYKATDKGQLEMNKEEEDQVLADWAKSELDKDKPRPKTLEDRVTALELAISGTGKK